MKTLQKSVLVLGAVLGLSVQAETNTAGTFLLTGKVVDAAGRPVADAVVERYQLVGATPYVSSDIDMQERVTTSAQGAFELRGSRTPMWLVARKPGLALGWTQLTPAPGAEPRLVLVSPGILAGVVVDEADKPVAGAEVSVAVAFSETPLDANGRRSFNYLTRRAARDCFTARTSPDGRFRLEGFPINASADLNVRAPGKALRKPALQYLSPDTMPYRAGQEDIRLVVEPAGIIEGKIMAEEAGQPLPVAQLMLQPDGPGFFAEIGQREPDRSGADGAFRMNDVSWGSYRIRTVFGTNAVPEWIAESVPVSVESGQTIRDVRIAAIRGGILEVATVRKSDRQPLDQVGVSANAQYYQAGATSASNGIARLRLPPGSYQVYASKEGWRYENVSASLEAGKTNRLEIELAPLPKITGVVRRPDGQAAAGLAVQIVGGFSRDDAKVMTDANGRFSVEWNPQRFGQNDMSYCLLIRDADRNLAVAQDIDENTGPPDLQLAPGLTLAGRAECDGKPVTNATAALIFWSGNRGMHLPGLGTGTNIPGRFEIPALPPGRRYGLTVSAPGYGQKMINDIDSSEAKRVELDPVELMVANRKLAGKVVDADDKPVAGANVNLSGDGQPNAHGRTDHEGRFSFEHVCEGQVRLSASARSSYGNVSAEAGDTNVVIRLGELYSTGAGGKSQKLKGTVTDPDGKPVAGAQVSVFPGGSSRGTKTDTNGAFNLTWVLEPWQMQSGSPSLVVRDLARNLAAAHELAEDTTNLTVQLKPALTLTGRVEGPDGVPLTNAQVGVWLLVSRTSSQIGEPLAPTDNRGRFEIKGLPIGQDYTVYAQAKGHGQNRQKVPIDAETNQVELEPLVLKLADKVLSGQVVNANDKAMSGVHVSLSGEEQPVESMTTDSKGRFHFRVCEGQVRLFAGGSIGYANVTAEAGDTNVVLQLSQSPSSSRPSVKPVSLKGKPLPDLTALGLAAEVVPTGKPILLCLVDIEQRPSRRLARLLVEQHDAIKQKGLAVLAVQSTLTSAESLNEWKDANPMPFPIGRVADKSDKTKWASGVESLPWLILTDAQGRVTAEGFPLEELDAKLQGSTQ